MEGAGTGAGKRAEFHSAGILPMRSYLILFPCGKMYS